MGFASTTRGQFPAEDPRLKLRVGRDELRRIGGIAGTHDVMYALMIDGLNVKLYRHNEKSDRWYRNSEKSPSGQEIITGKYRHWLEGTLP